MYVVYLFDVSGLLKLFFKNNVTFMLTSNLSCYFLISCVQNVEKKHSIEKFIQWNVLDNYKIIRDAMEVIEGTNNLRVFLFIYVIFF